MLPSFFTCLLLIYWLVNPESAPEQKVGTGRHPSVSTDPAGTVHVGYDRGETLYDTTTQTGAQMTGSVADKRIHYLYGKTPVSGDIPLRLSLNLMTMQEMKGMRHRQMQRM